MAYRVASTRLKSQNLLALESNPQSGCVSKRLGTFLRALSVSKNIALNFKGFLIKNSVTKTSSLYFGGPCVFIDITEIRFKFDAKLWNLRQDN